MDILELFFIGYIAVIGLVIGSFLNVCIYRIPKKISITKGNKGRSMCTACGKTLKWYDLFPLFSYLFLGGKCRYCKKHISIRYPIVELLNAILWTFCGYYFGMEWETLIYCVFCSTLLVLAMIDLDIQEIPYRFQAIIGGLGIISLFLSDTPSMKERLIGIFVISVPMLIITFICNGFGGGDIQLMATCGFLLGYEKIIVAMIIGTISAGIIGIIILITRKKKKEKTMIPFGPFLSIGLVIALFWSDYLIRWYASFF